MRSVIVNSQKYSKVAEVLLYFFAFADLLPRPFEGKSAYAKRTLSGKSEAFSYYKIMRKMEQKGFLKIHKEGRRNAYTITERGRLEAIFIKAQVSEKKPWDGKWRMVLFDIPEDARSDRNRLRGLLKSNGYKQVQKSVFINPWPLNREAIVYLKETGLDKYIRIFRIDDADNEPALKKMFSL